jgi:hypothetical protein
MSGSFCVFNVVNMNYRKCEPLLFSSLRHLVVYNCPKEDSA